MTRRLWRVTINISGTTKTEIWSTNQLEAHCFGCTVTAVSQLRSLRAIETFFTPLPTFCKLFLHYRNEAVSQPCAICKFAKLKQTRSQSCMCNLQARCTLQESLPQRVNYVPTVALFEKYCITNFYLGCMYTFIKTKRSNLC